MGATRGLVPLGGGVKGGGNPNGCGGGTSVGVGASVAGCDEFVLESESKVSVITDLSFVSTKGDSVGEANPVSVSDGCKNGFAVVGGLRSMSSSGTTSIESLD
jgi:hypothetical protein